MNKGIQSIIVVSIMLVMLFFGIVILDFKKPPATAADAPIVVWSGSGNDGVCGGIVNSGNWWSCAANWSTGVVPTSSDHIVFDKTSSKDSVIDANFSGSTHSITIQYSYGGTISQQRDLTVTNDFNQNGATFISDPNYQFSVGGSFFVADNQISNGSVKVIKSDSSGNLYIGGTFLNISGLPIKYFAKWDGDKWSSVGDSLDGSVNTIVVDSNQNVYIGGSFKKAGNLLTNGIAKWNGTSWSALDGGVTEGYGSSKIAAEVKILQVDNSNRVYAGGTFENAGSLDNANHIARWNGTAWEKFGYGVGGNMYNGGSSNNFLSGYVSNIIVRDNPSPSASDKDIYISGSFSGICGNALCSSGNTSGNNIAKFDGLSLSMGVYGGTSSSVSAMTFDSSNKLVVYSGSGITASKCSIGNFDGSIWSCYNGFNGSVFKLSNIDNIMYAGGDFSFPGYNNLADFSEAIKNPPTFNYYGSNVALGYGVDDVVFDIEKIGGSIYMAGSFKGACINTSCSSFNQTSAIVKYDSSNPDRTKRLSSPFNKASFLRYVGDGTSSNPYRISDVYGLQGMNSKDTGYFLLSNDINASVANNWNNGQKFIPLYSELKPFNGNFNGNNNAISNISISNFRQDGGLFGVLGNNSQVSSISLLNTTLSSNSFIKNAGILAGKNYGIISGVTVSGTIDLNSPQSSPGKDVGGIVGYSSNLKYGTGDVTVTSITNSSANININASNIYNVGGILGRQERIEVQTAGYPFYTLKSTIVVTLSNLTSQGSININNSKGSIGGIVGLQDYENATIDGSTSSINISVTINDINLIADNAVEFIGGLVGYSFGTISNSNSSGAIVNNITVDNVDTNYIGGLAGKADSLIRSRSAITGSHSNGNISISQSTGLVSNIGGLSGEITIGPSFNSYSTGNITVNSMGEVKNVGGLAGSGNGGNITDCYSTGTIEIDNHMASNQLLTGSFGGLLGFANDLDIVNSHSSGNLKINSDSSCNNFGGAAGLVGIFSGGVYHRIKNSYTESKTTANCTKLGLLFGFSTTHKTGDINNSGAVDDSDFTLLLFNWGNTPANRKADLNMDNGVDDIDFTLLLFNWGT